MAVKYFENPVFIVGHPKSGTSLLNAILDSHSNLLVIPEESDLYIVFEKLNYRSPSEIVERLFKQTHFINFVKKKAEHDISGNLDYSEINLYLFKEQLKRCLETLDKPIEHKQIFHAVVSAYYEVSKKKIDYSDIVSWVEKTPRHLEFVDIILSTYENPRIIFSIRDPRDNYVSYKKKHKSLGPEEFSASWLRAVSIFKKHLESNNATRFLLIRHEDLINETKLTMSKICTFLSIEYNPALESPSKFSVPWQGNSMFNTKFNGISKTASGRYKIYDNQDEIHTVEHLLAKEMTYFGYEIKQTTKLKKRIFSTVMFWFYRLKESYSSYKKIKRFNS